MVRITASTSLALNLIFLLFIEQVISFFFDLFWTSLFRFALIPCVTWVFFWFDVRIFFFFFFLFHRKKNTENKTQTTNMNFSLMFFWVTKIAKILNYLIPRDTKKNCILFYFTKIKITAKCSKTWKLENLISITEYSAETYPEGFRNWYTGLCTKFGAQKNV